MQNSLTGTSQRLAERLRVPIPDRMAHLGRDVRGYPVPAIVMVDRNGKPHFTVNDETKRQKIIAADRCPICAGVLLRGRWFVGGPMSAFHTQGTYIDTAMHYECMEYALKVCPYLAARNYSGRIDDSLVPEEDRKNMIVNDPTVMPDRPQTFVAVMAVKTTYVQHPLSGRIEYVRPGRPYKIIEFWQNGKRLPGEEGLKIALQSVAPEMVSACITKSTQIRSDQP